MTVVENADGKVQVIDPSKLDIEPMIDAIRENRPRTTREEAIERLGRFLARRRKA